MSRLSAIERAYQIARTGQVTRLTEIKAKLRAEGYGNLNYQLYGKALADDLRRVCAAARGANFGLEKFSAPG